MKSSRFQNLVERYISEESTREEVEELKQLLKDPQYVSVLDDIMDRQLTENTASAEDYREVVERLKNAIGQKIAGEGIPIFRRLSFSRWAAAAAIIIILGTASFLWFSSRTKSTVAKNDPVPGIDIAPGQEGAILTLADGSTVVLDSLGNGIIATQNGTRLMLSNGQLAYNANGTSNAAVTYNTVTTPKGRQFRLLLQDGTKVWLNAASSIRYPTIFAGKERKVEVTGEVYFEVAKNEKKPFHVKVNDETEIEVLGTHFNINSYADEATVNTTLLEGLVRITNKKEKAVLKPGQQAQVAGVSMQPQGIKILNDVDVDKVMAWKNGVFNFQDATLKEVMHQLERWYDIDVEYEKGIPKFEFFGKMSRDLSLSEVLRGLQVSEVHFRIEAGRKVIVMP